MLSNGTGVYHTRPTVSTWRNPMEEHTALVMPGLLENLKPLDISLVDTVIFIELDAQVFQVFTHLLCRLSHLGQF